MPSITSRVAREERAAFIETAGQRVRYRVHGDGPALLMLHGIGAPLELWRPLEAELGDFQTITVDPPGSGQSSTPRGRFGMREFAGVMDDLLTHLGLDSANVLGLSFGGMIALELARHRPTRVEQLVVASTPVGLPVNPIAMTANVTRARHPFRPHFGQAGRRFGQAGPVKDEEQMSQDSSLLRLLLELQGKAAPSVRGFLVQLLAASTWSSRPWLWTLDMPVLAISGSDDRIVPPANSRLIASAVGNGRLEVVPGGGHLVLLKESTRASQIIRSFLRDE